MPITKQDAKYLLKGLEMYKKKVTTMHTQAMTLGMYESAKEIQTDMEAISKLEAEIQEKADG